MVVNLEHLCYNRIRGDGLAMRSSHRAPAHVTNRIDSQGSAGLAAGIHPRALAARETAITNGALPGGLPPMYHL